VPSLTVPVINEIEINLPPLPEQKAIAETLSSLDDKIDLLHRQNNTLEQMAETLFRQWFVAEAKEDWETKKLDEILSISSSKRIFYKEYVDTGIPFYRSKEIIELSKGGATSTELFISEERFNEINSKFGSPNQGDILLTSVGTLGVSYRVRENDKFYFKDGNLTWFSNFQVLPSSIIYCWLNSAIGKEELNNITIGSTQAALTISGLRQIEIIIPPKEVINKLNNDLEAFYSKIEFNQKQIRSIEKMRDALLPKLMSGEVTVN
jgi:type I restriction enzyme S subunit